MTPRSETLAFRAWAHCQPIGWNITIRDLAEALGESVSRTRSVVVGKGWQQRLRAGTAQHEDSAAHMRNAFDGPVYLRRGDIDARIVIGADE